jgi:ABC-2 type transport system permease protein
MIALSGLFFAIDELPPALEALARILPLAHAVSLLDGIWRGESWLAHLDDVAALAVIFLVVTAVSARVFRWE